MFTFFCYSVSDEIYTTEVFNGGQANGKQDTFHIIFRTFLANLRCLLKIVSGIFIHVFATFGCFKFSFLQTFDELSKADSGARGSHIIKFS